jgi:proteasome lid subunit RPN8/RPN11
MCSGQKMILMTNTITKICISRHLISVVQNHAQRDYPCEACGFLIGHARGNIITVSDVIPATNAAAAATRKRAYRIDPRHWMRTEQHVSSQGLMIIGIYHSHPDQMPMLSQTDINALWPSLIYLIVSSGPHQQHPPMAWRLNDATGKPEACDLHLLE